VPSPVAVANAFAGKPGVIPCLGDIAAHAGPAHAAGV